MIGVLQPIATIIGAVIAVVVPLLFIAAGDRPSRRRRRELAVLESLQQLRPGVPADAARRKIDDLTSDYLADIEIGLRDDGRVGRIAAAAGLIAGVGSIGLSMVAEKTTDPAAQASWKSLALAALIVQILLAIGTIVFLILTIVNSRLWGRVGRSARRRAAALEKQARSRLREGRRRFDEINSETTKALDQIREQSQHAGKLNSQVNETVTRANAIVATANEAASKAEVYAEKINRLLSQTTDDAQQIAAYLELTPDQVAKLHEIPPLRLPTELRKLKNAGEGRVEISGADVAVVAAEGMHEEVEDR